MRIMIYGAIGIVALVLQIGLVPHLLVHGQGPTLAVVPVVVIGLLYGPSEGAWAGAVIGALTDLSLGAGWGLGTLLYMTVGFVAGRFAFAGRAALPILALVGSALAALAVRLGGVLALVVAGAHLSLTALAPDAVGLAYTAVLAPPLLALLDGRVGGRRRRAQAQV